jgi:hypothetical protein
VAVFAGIKDAAAFHFDGDDIHWESVMSTAGLGINIDSADVLRVFFARFKSVWPIHLL